MEIARANIKSIGPNLKSLIDLENPRIDWLKMADAMGVRAVSVNTGEELAHEIKGALSESGPNLIEMVLNRKE